VKFVISLVVSLLVLLSSSSLAQTVKPPFDVESAENPPEPFISRLQAPSPSSLLLRWESAAPGVTGFRIYRDNQPIAIVPAEMREYEDSGLSRRPFIPTL
jgi:hypothetical protein